MSGYELIEIAATIDQQMRGDFQIGDLTEVRIRAGIETVEKKIADVVPAENPGRQADCMDHDQRNLAARGARVEIR